MRMVSAAEAVAGIKSGEQVYVHSAAATPSVLLDALVARAPRAGRRQGRPPPHRRARAAPGAGDGRPLPPPRAVHRAQRAPGGQRGPRRLHAGLPVGRADAVPARHPAARRGADQRVAAGRARLLLAGHLGRSPCPPRSSRARPSSPRSTRPCRARWATASSTSTTSTWAVEVDVPPYAVARPAHRRRRAAHRRVRGRARARRRDAADGHRRHPRGGR